MLTEGISRGINYEQPQESSFEKLFWEQQLKASKKYELTSHNDTFSYFSEVEVHNSTNI